MEHTPHKVIEIEIHLYRILIYKLLEYTLTKKKFKMRV